MRRLVLLAAAVLLCVSGLAPPADAQTWQRKTGTITTAGADCSVATSCVTLSDVSRTGNGTVVVTGTWVATLQFEGTLDGTNWFALNVQAQGSTAFVTSATANGQWSVPYALLGLRVRASAYTSGTATVNMVVTSAARGGGGGGGAGGGTINNLAIFTAATTLGDYAGTTACTNQFMTTLSAAGAATCASVALASAVTGTLPIANGGSNATSFTTSNGIVKYDGTRLVTGLLTDDGTNVTAASGQILGTAGGVAATATQFSHASDTDSGFGFLAADVLGVAAGGVWYLRVENGAFSVRTGNTFRFASGTSLDTPVVSLVDVAAGNLRQGAAAANPPVAQTRSVQNASGTDIAGADVTYEGSQGTGTGAGGGHIFRVALAGASGSSLNALTTAFRLTASPPTVSGFGTSPSVLKGTPLGFEIDVGTGGTASTGTITFPTASNGWIVTCYDVTTPASYITHQTGGTTTTATVTNYSRTTGLAIAWTASDVLRCRAIEY